jgi:hypothetical protein
MRIGNACTARRPSVSRSTRIMRSEPSASFRRHPDTRSGWLSRGPLPFGGSPADREHWLIIAPGVSGT